MKKAFALALAVMLALITATGALADTAQYATTQVFMDTLDEFDDVTYDYAGVDDDGDEHVILDLDLDGGPTITVNCFFDEEQELCYMRAWYFITFEEKNYYPVLIACNDMNASYRYTTFYVDETDMTVTLGIDNIIRPDGSLSDILVDELVYLWTIAEHGWDAMGQYDIGTTDSAVPRPSRGDKL